MLQQFPCSSSVARLFLSASAVAISCSGSAALGAERTHVCNTVGEYRLIKLVEPGGDARACEVRYARQEGAPDKILWGARNSTAYCEKRANDLIVRLKSSGFDCQESVTPTPASALVDGVEGPDAGMSKIAAGTEQVAISTVAIASTQEPASGVAAASAVEETAPPQPRSTNDGPIIEALKAGKPLIDLRYRFETKMQEGFAEDAVANTVRTRFGFETGEIYNLKVLVEFENVFSIGDDSFNSTTNGRSQFPVVADPDATEINRAQVTFTGIEKTPITVGRQRFNLNNHRFVGAVDWRQNQQTFDAARLNSTYIDNLTVDYLYISRVHRIFGDDHPVGEFDSDSHVIAGAYNAGAYGTLKAYGVLLDLEEAPRLSSATWGVRYENALAIDDDAGIKLAIVGEYAQQRDYAANPINYSHDYVHGEVTLSVAPFSGKVGYELLGGDGAIGFSTPLATLHKFQGFADAFLATPANGLQDLYGTIAYSWKDAPFGTTVKFFATYHDFKSDVGSLDFGDEIDAGMTIGFRKHWSVNLKGAVYNSGADGAADRNLVWAGLRFRY